MGRWLREPLLQFVLIGVALFAASERWNRGAEPLTQADRVELTEGDLQQIALGWVAQGRPAPSAAQLRSLADARVREEILYREALALGLDENDTIVRRRLAQKMEFLFEDVAALQEPTAGELTTWFELNRERFTQPGRITFRHLYFSPDRRADRARADAASALPRIAGAAGDAPEAIALGDPFMFQDFYGDRAPDDVAKTFGPSFTRAVFQVSPGRWAGPIDSGYGSHLVWVDAVTPARVPALEEVEADVRMAWTEEQRAAIRDAAFAAMRARYEIVLPEEIASPARAGRQPAGVELAEGPR
jgi:parvulin-like peptidyl-prolyl isomerase